MMRRIKTADICFLAVLGTAMSLLARESSESNDIVGYVKDATSGEALPYANVLIAGTNQGANTNADGHFVLVNVSAFPCTLTVRYIGYVTQSVPVSNPGRSLSIGLMQTVLQGEGVSVTAPSQMLDALSKEVSQITFSPRQLSALPNVGEADVFRAMQLLPGVGGANEGQSGLYVRGGTPDQNLILFDGMTIYHVDHFFGFFSAFNADAVKDVQLYKGGFPAEFGGRISSVVNITGKSGDQNRIRFGAGANLLSAHAEFEAPLWNAGTILFTVRRSYTDFIQSSLYNSIYKLMTGGSGNNAAGGPVRNRGMGGMGPGGTSNSMSGEFTPKFYFYDLNGKITLTPSPKDILSFSLYSGKDNLDKSQDYSQYSFRMPGSETGASLSTTDLTRWGNVGFSGKWSRQWQDRFHTDLLAAHSDYFSDYDRSDNVNTSLSSADTMAARRDFSNASKEHNEVKDLSVKLDADWDVSSAHRLGLGLGFSRFDSRFDAMRNDTLAIYSQNSRSVQSFFYLQDRWALHPLELTLGFRGSYYDMTREMYWEPRASAQFELFRNFKIKGAWGQYYQFVNRITNEDVTQGSRDFWLLTDKQMPPAYAEHRILGISYENPDVVLSVEGYGKNLENLVEFSRRFQGPQGQQNFFFLGTGVVKGVEFLAQKKRGSLTGWIGYTLSKVENTFPLINDGNPFAADWDRRHEIHVVSRYTVGAWNFAATWVYATGNPYTSPESQYFITLLDGKTLSYIHVSGKNANRLPDYHRLDLSASRTFELDNWTIEGGISLFNAYNRKNVWYRDYNLNTVPVTVTNVLMLGFTPTVFVQFNLK